MKHAFFARRPLLLGLCLLALLMPGCRGCDDGLTPQERAQKQQEEEERRLKEEEEKKKKAPMVVSTLRPAPTQSDSPRLFVKPGHWSTVSQEMKRNYDDWVGRTSQEVVDSNGQPIPLDYTAFSLRSQRPVALSKGQTKDVESVFFAPPITRKFNIRARISGRDGLDVVPLPLEPVTPMQSHQYHFVVLAANPASYGRLGSLRSVNSPVHFEFDLLSSPSGLPPRLQYRVVAPELGERAPLPDNLYCLTSTAYLLWDEVDPTIFEPPQREALVDWLQWGGQLIISGPDSLALLRDSFLAPYLPATAGDAWEITAADLQPMVDAWGVGKGPELQLPRPWSGVRLDLVEDDSDRRESDSPVARATAQLRCGELFAERRVGRGRVLVSAMQLNQRGLQNWESGFECLMNAVVLRRPPRRFRNDNYSAGVRFDEEAGYGVSGDSPGESTLAVEWADGRDKVAPDAAVNTAFRMLSRDSYSEAHPWRYTRGATPDASNPGFGGQLGQMATDATAVRPPSYPGGAGGWDDFNAVSEAARSSLREAAGVTVPDSGFVLACIGFYLLVLAPFNWMVFRAIGRVELAWVAAPLIAIAGTVVVVKLAQLDIGFVRAQTQIALLETQPNYPRGSLTRYTGVYTSLGTNYEITFDDPAAVAAPFASGREFELLSGQRISQVTYDRQDKARLEGLTVSSSTTGMVHSEEMHAVSGALRLGTATSGTLQIENLSDQDLRQLVVVYRPVQRTGPGEQAPPPSLRGCWIGKLPQRESMALAFSAVPISEDAAAFQQERTQDAGSAAAKRNDEMNLEPLWRVALNPAEFEPGEYRAVARIDRALPGMTVRPAAAQESAATLWVAHLQYEIPTAPEPDTNAPVDFAKEE
ncbi:hypothetical protein Pla123a_14670 [Posidoniimonas polymericola]|uniref:DUF4350 domain-containing protein n=1 Tax=Posidoniimonas polymericola TaxID=2528002 RepID=A0A5C5YRU4_9BACT|nr:hypothetical protein [Posidoniimonas polymericola]TWT77671.1 hypothetical protein Pla123a_14670 [Posidoniimonas polymericola]